MDEDEDQDDNKVEDGANGDVAGMSAEREMLKKKSCLVTTKKTFGYFKMTVNPKH